MKLVSRAFEVEQEEDELLKFVIPDRHLVTIAPATSRSKGSRVLPSEAKAWCADNLKNYSLYATGEGYVILAPAEDNMLAQLRFS